MSNASHDRTDGSTGIVVAAARGVVCVTTFATFAVVSAGAQAPPPEPVPGLSPGLAAATGQGSRTSARPLTSPVAGTLALIAPARDTRSERVATSGSVAVFPFGHSQPVVTCTLLRACVIELQAGESVVNEPIAGDAVRWMIERAHAGPGGRDALVVVKPRFCEITTNLVIPTDRRIYDLTLDSPPCGRRGTAADNPQQPYARHVRFSYPDDSSGPPRAWAAGVRTEADGDGASAATARPGAVNRAYRIARARRGPFGLFGRRPLDFPWRPAAIYDDGAHLVIELPDAARHQALPLLYGLEADGARTLLNYTVQTSPAGDAVFVADRVVARAVLVLSAAAREQRLVIENRAVGRRVASAAAPEGR